MTLMELTEGLVRQMPRASQVSFLSLAMMWSDSGGDLPPALRPLYDEGTNRGIYITSGIVQEAMRKARAREGTSA